MPEPTTSTAIETRDSQILRDASNDSNDWDDSTWAAWFRTAERAHRDGGENRRPLFDKVGAQQARVTELQTELERYVGKEPTIADEMAYLRRCLNAVRDLCDEARLGSCLGVTIEAVEQALNGERIPSPDDRRRRIYIDGEGKGWLDQSTGHNGLRWVAPLEIFPGDAEPASKVTERTGGLHEIGRCW